MGPWKGFPQFSDEERNELETLGAAGLANWRGKPAEEREASFQYSGWRVGLYFEALVESWLGLRGWEVLASNLVVKKERQTLGAFDLVVRALTGRLSIGNWPSNTTLVWEGHGTTGLAPTKGTD